MTYEIIIDGKTHRVELTRGEGGWHCRLDGDEIAVDAVVTRPDVMSLIIGGTAYEVKREVAHSGDTHFWVKNSRFAAEVRDPRSLRSRKAAAGGGEGPQKLTAPMPGKVVRVLLPAGSAVDAGQGVLVVEAMKMQNELTATVGGVVKAIHAEEKKTVEAGAKLVTIG